MATTTPASAPFQQEKTFSSYNADQGKKYSAIRRDYHSDVYKFVLDHHVATGGQLGTIMDVGCGPGNATRSFAPHFEHAIGLDPSEGMLATAKAENPHITTKSGASIRFEQSIAEQLGLNLSPPIADESIDLITIANAAHWFDMNGFYPAAARVLRPGGTLALWTSGHITPHPDLPNSVAIGMVLDKYRQKELEEYITPGNRLARDSYKDILLPWTIAKPVTTFTQEDFVRKLWEPERSFFVGEREVDLDTFEKVGLDVWWSPVSFSRSRSQFLFPFPLLAGDLCVWIETDMLLWRRC
jgi:trans-aconitate 3-methyltransferase